MCTMTAWGLTGSKTAPLENKRPVFCMKLRYFKSTRTCELGEHARTFSLDVDVAFYRLIWFESYLDYKLSQIVPSM